MPAQARGDGTEVRVTVGVETDELGVQDHAVPAHGLTDGGELGELTGGVSTGPRPQRKPSALDADLGANSVPFTSSTHVADRAVGRGAVRASIGAMNRGSSSRATIRSSVRVWPQGPWKESKDLGLQCGGRLGGALLELVVALERDQHRSHLVALREHHLLKLALI